MVAACSTLPDAPIQSWFPPGDDLTNDNKLGLWTISMRRKTMLWRWLLHLMACGWWRCPTQGRTLLNYQSLPSSRFSFLITDSQWSNFHSEVTHPHRKKCAVPWPGHVICLQQRRLRTQWVSRTLGLKFPKKNWGMGTVGDCDDIDDKRPHGIVCGLLTLKPW